MCGEDDVAECPASRERQRWLETWLDQSGRWGGSEAVAAHDVANPVDVRRAVAGEHFRDVLEIARAKQTRTDDGEHARVNVAVVSESVDHAAGV
jgi:hypothetical protein